jgi:hypothetical protein
MYYISLVLYQVILFKVQQEFMIEILADDFVSHVDKTPKGVDNIKK